MARVEDPGSPAVGVAVVRVCFDPAHPTAFTARIIECDDVAHPSWVLEVCGTADETSEEITRWLHRLVGPGPAS